MEQKKSESIDKKKGPSACKKDPRPNGYRRGETIRWQPVRTAEDATRVLASAGREVISLQGGWIVREVDDNQAYREIVCDSADELCACAREQQRRQLGFLPAGQDSQFRDSLGSSSLSSAGNRHQATLSGWMRSPMEIKYKEVAA